jgi:hypothetical protein
MGNPEMGVGKLRKKLQSARQWSVSEKRLRSMVRAIETGDLIN